MPETVVWVRTVEAAQITGRSRSQLLRLIRDGFLTRGTHWLKGPHKSSPITWNLQALETFFTQQAAMPSPGNTDLESNA